MDSLARHILGNGPNIHSGCGMILYLKALISYIPGPHRDLAALKEKIPPLCPSPITAVSSSCLLAKKTPPTLLVSPSSISVLRKGNHPCVSAPRCLNARFNYSSSYGIPWTGDTCGLGTFLIRATLPNENHGIRYQRMFSAKRLLATA